MADEKYTIHDEVVGPHSGKARLSDEEYEKILGLKRIVSYDYVDGGRDYTVLTSVLPIHYKGCTYYAMSYSRSSHGTG